MTLSDSALAYYKKELGESVLYTLSDAERAFMEEALDNPGKLSLNDLRYAYYLAGLEGSQPTEPEWGPVDISFTSDSSDQATYRGSFQASRKGAVVTLSLGEVSVGPEGLVSVSADDGIPDWVLPPAVEGFADVTIRYDGAAVYTLREDLFSELTIEISGNYPSGEFKVQYVGAEV